MLTDTTLRTPKPRSSAYRLAVTNGLCIEVRPSGANSAAHGTDDGDSA